LQLPSRSESRGRQPSHQYSSDNQRAIGRADIVADAYTFSNQHADANPETDQHADANPETDVNSETDANPEADANPTSICL
jgi:hypothetical protein